MPHNSLCSYTTRCEFLHVAHKKFLFFFIFSWLLGLFALPGHIDTLFPVQPLYPEPRTRPYEICISLSKFAQSVDCRSAVGLGLQDPQQLW